jgi:hypothetical protein
MLRHKTIEDVYRTFDSIEPDEYGCHRWPWATDYKGYGRTRFGRAHRLALERKLGRPIRPGYQALHHCDYQPCVNPDHLYEGTDKDNQRDRKQNNPECYDHLKGAAGIEGRKKGVNTVKNKWQNDPEFRARREEQLARALKSRWDKYRERQGISQ